MRMMVFSGAKITIEAFRWRKHQPHAGKYLRAGSRSLQRGLKARKIATSCNFAHADEPWHWVGTTDGLLIYGVYSGSAGDITCSAASELQTAKSIAFGWALKAMRGAEAWVCVLIVRKKREASYSGEQACLTLLLAAFCPTL